VLETLRTVGGVLRSLRIYYGRRSHAAGMDRLYSRFVHPGDLVFDVGAHVGDRVGSFRRLGARVVAVEPQPALVRTLKLLYGRDADVVIEAVAVGRVAGTAEMLINLSNPTVSTLSTDFIRAAHGAPGWEAQRWSRKVRVPVTSLDSLIAKYGVPAFIKLDLEGFEGEALAGLTRAPKVLSFEFTTIQREVARACIARCGELGYRRFQVALGESQTLVHPDWLDDRALLAWLNALPQAANSGDVYASLG